MSELLEYRRGNIVSNVPADELRDIAPSIVLIDPKYARNVGQVVRLANCYGISQVWMTGQRVALVGRNKKYRLPREERMRATRNVDIIRCQKPINQFKKDVPIIAIEFGETEYLPEFEHEQREAVYVFGPEDGSIPKVMRHLCWQFVQIPTRYCLNLSTAVATVLYDRALKLGDFDREVGSLSPLVEPLEVRRSVAGVQNQR